MHKKSKKNTPCYTETEIGAQPALWQKVFDLLEQKEKEIKAFISPILEIKDLQIILTGAGSSAFIGEAAEGLIQKNTGCSTKAIPTTDLVTHPDLHFLAHFPTLLISFARSGNSPESLETVKLANDFCKEVYHLVITCNKDGKLAFYAKENNSKAFVVQLPENSNDKSLAMTGSFTSMLLSVLIVSTSKAYREMKPEIVQIIGQGKKLLANYKAFQQIAQKDFERVVFLGSGPLLGIARECHLKLQELTDGKVICKHDSFLGFRHGPRAVTNENTLLVYLFSPDDHVYNYELDLALSIAKDPRNLECLSIGREENLALNSCLNIELYSGSEQELYVIPVALVGQLLGLYKSLQVGLNPDNPSVFGAISRVVQGVNIYNYQKNSRK